MEEAFLLRPNEEYVSTNWLEHFHSSDRLFQLTGVRQTLRDKGRDVRPSGSLVVLNVGASVAECSSKLNLDITFTVLGQSDDPSHTGIYGLEPLIDDDRRNASGAMARTVTASEVHPAVP